MSVYHSVAFVVNIAVKPTNTHLYFILSKFEKRMEKLCLSVCWKRIYNSVKMSPNKKLFEDLNLCGYMYYLISFFKLMRQCFSWRARTGSRKSVTFVLFFPGKRACISTVSCCLLRVVSHRPIQGVKRVWTSMLGLYEHNTNAFHFVGLWGHLIQRVMITRANFWGAK